MTDFVETQKGIMGEIISLRTAILDMVGNNDLTVGLGGKSLTLGELLLEQANFQQSYINTFKTFKQDWSVKATAPEPLTVDALKHLYADLDSQLFTRLEQLTENDLVKSIDRGGWDLSVEGVLIAYHEAVLIFTAKASVYLKAMNKDLTGQLKSWIG